MNKKYLITITLILIIFLYWCNKNITIDNWNIISWIISWINSQIENKSDLQNTSGEETNIQAQKYGLYQNKKEWFNLKVNTGRKIQENINWSLVFISSPKKLWDKINENLSINITSGNNNQTVEEYYSGQKQWMQNYIKNYKEIWKEQYKIAEEIWIKTIYQWTLNNNKLQRQQIIFQKNWKFFRITYTATQDTFDEYIKQINAIIKSLEF